MKYYDAYDERYKKSHEEGLIWFTEKPTPEVLNWVVENMISESEEILDVGCGEGRDLLALAEEGYNASGIDASKHAVRKIEELANKRKVEVSVSIADAVNLENFDKTYKWIYSVATLHMLVVDQDRKDFLKTLYKLLADDGKLLLVNKGNGVDEIQTDTERAFELTERMHMDTEKELQVATTSFRSVNWEYHLKELAEAGFIVDDKVITTNYQYDKCMIVYLSK